MQVLQILQQSIADGATRGRLRMRSGPFTVAIDPNSEMPWDNYAVPTGSYYDSQSVCELIDLFSKFGREPRVELLRGVSANVEEALLEGGFEPGDPMAVLVCEVSHYSELGGDNEVAVLDPESDPRPYLTVGSEAFGDDAPISEHRIERWRDAVRNERTVCVQLERSGNAVSIGCLVMGEIAVEVASIATLPEHRKRGYACTVVSKLVMEARRRKPNAVVWLTAANSASRSVYERVGFQVVGHQVNYRKPLAAVNG